jgi:ATP-dependent RNA helicase DDX19/DBP5
MSAEGASAGGGLADRITKPDTTTTSSTSWADEVNSPSNANPPSAPDNDLASKASAAPVGEKQESVPQMDGATEPFGGSQLQEPDYEVEIKLADMQADPNNPLYSATSFEKLGL